MDKRVTRRQVLEAAGFAVMAASPLASAIAADSPTTSPATRSPSDTSATATGMARVEPYVQPGMNWGSGELNDFLAELPPKGLLSLKQALGLLDPKASEASLHGGEQDIADIQKQLLWESSNILAYPFSDPKKIPYHEVVKWLAGKADVDDWIVETQPTFLLERAYIERVFTTVWEKLTAAQRRELLDKIDTTHSIQDKTAIASLSGAGALAALATTVYFAGFTFYTTMSITICASAGFFGATLPFAAYTTASSLVVFLSGPVGWAAVAILLAAGIALWGRADEKKTAAAIIQLHMLKVAALKEAGKPDSIFQILGDPLKRQIVGKWSWRLPDGTGTIIFDFKGDGSFTAESKPNKRPPLSEGGGWVSSGKGEWSVASNKLTVHMTHVWVGVFWKEHDVKWIDGNKIVAVTPTTVRLDTSPDLVRQ